MSRISVVWILCLSAALLFLAACGGGSISSPTPTPTPTPNPTPAPTPTPTGTPLTGSVHAGSAAVSGASVQFYAAGSSGNGSQATALMSAAVKTDSSGNFTVNYTCPSASAQVYLVATGGNPGLASGTNNTALAMMTALGACGNLTSSSTAVLNEATTVGSVFALAPFMSSGANVGATSTNAKGLANAFAKVNNLVSVTAGTSPGPALPSGATVASKVFNTIANLIYGCTSSSGPCASLMTAATPPGAASPANTIDVIVNLALYPGQDPPTLYALIPASPPFQPALTSAPNDWMLPITYTGGGLNMPTALAIDSTGNVWVADYFSAVSEFSSQGKALSPAAGFTGGGLRESYGLTVDPHDNAWVTNQETSGGVNGGHGSLTELSPSGQILSGTGFIGGGINFPNAAASDAQGNIWVSNYNHPSASVFSNAGTAMSGANGYGSGEVTFPLAVAVDGSGTAWLANSSTNTVTSVSSDGMQVHSYTCCDGATGLAVDSHGNIWVANFLGDSISELSSSGSVISSGYTDLAILRPNGIAVDGRGNIWVANYHGNSLVLMQGADGPTPGTVFWPMKALGLSAGMLLPYSIAIDASGSIWAANSASGVNTITEFVGAAGPVKTPLLGPVAKP